MRDRKFKKSRAVNKIFLVICEGETEETYVRLLRQHYRLPIEIKTRVSGNAINRRLVSQYVVELGLPKSVHCEIFYIYDGDIPAIAQRISQLPGNAVLTNPCIEFWYLLHIRDHKSALSSEAMVRTLKSSDPTWQPYVKGTLSAKQSQLLIESMPCAVQRARMCVSGQNPSTDINIFIDALEMEKGRR